MTNTVSFTETERAGVSLLTAPNISCVHAFTTRAGGVSRGVYESLNLGENRGDDPQAVRENYARLKRALGIGPLVFSRQVHGTTVKYVSGADAREPFDPIPYEADGLVTDEPGTGLIVFTADCIPILLHDPVRRVAAAVHAGWRGTVNNIAGAAVRRMSELGSDPSDIRAAIGPGISFCCFETGPEVPEALRAVLGGAAEEFIAPARSPGKLLVDLKGANAALLARAGLSPERIAVSDLCTACNPDRFWSHRVTGGVRGSQAAVIVLPGLK